MIARRWKRGTTAIWLAASCSWPATALAQDCSDKTKLLSSEWFLSKVDCGADKLVEAGAKSLSDAGLELAEAALDQYLPGLSSLLFNDDDKFAADFADLKVHIEAQTDRILGEFLAGRVREQTAQLLAVMNDMQDFADDPMYRRAVTIDRAQGMDDVLRLLMIDLMFPLATTWSAGVTFGADYSQLGTADLDHFHSLITIAGMRTEVIPLLASASAYAGIVNDYDQPTNAELAVVAQDAHAESMSDLNLLLNNLEPYLAAVSSKDLFRIKSDERFTGLLSGNACGSFAYTYSKAAVGGDPLAPGSEHYQFYYTDSGLRGTPPSCFGTYSGNGTYRIVRPDGTETTGTTSHAAFVNTVQLNYGLNKSVSHQSFLLGTYGSARPAITRWYRLANRVPPELAIDVALRDALRSSSTSVTNILNAIANASESPLSSYDKRLAEDIILEQTAAGLYMFALAATAGADFMNNDGRHPIRVIRRYLHGQAGVEVFQEMGAAKFAVLMR